MGFVFVLTFFYAFIIGAIFTAWYGFVLTVAWNLVLPALVGAPTITVVQGIAIAFIVAMLSKAWRGAVVSVG